MTYRITNNSHQEGMVNIEGQWVTVLPGEMKYTEVFPGARTQNLVVKKIVSTSDHVEYKQPKPGSASRVLIQKESSDEKVEKEEK